MDTSGLQETFRSLCASKCMNRELRGTFLLGLQTDLLPCFVACDANVGRYAPTTVHGYSATMVHCAQSRKSV